LIIKTDCGFFSFEKYLATLTNYGTGNNFVRGLLKNGIRKQSYETVWFWIENS
jgi:hypothetical protein